MITDPVSGEPPGTVHVLCEGHDHRLVLDPAGVHTVDHDDSIELLADIFGDPKPTCLQVAEVHGGDPESVRVAAASVAIAATAGGPPDTFEQWMDAIVDVYQQRLRSDMVFDESLPDTADRVAGWASLSGWDSVRPWVEHGVFTPEEAELFTQANVGPDEASAWWGTVAMKDLPGWIGRGLTPEDAMIASRLKDRDTITAARFARKRQIGFVSWVLTVAAYAIAVALAVVVVVGGLVWLSGLFLDSPVLRAVFVLLAVSVILWVVNRFVEAPFDSRDDLAHQLRQKRDRMTFSWYEPNRRRPVTMPFVPSGWTTSSTKGLQTA